MPDTPDYRSDFQENFDALLEDVVLLNALAAQRDRPRSPLLNYIPARIFSTAQQRILDYLTQHAADLYHITEYVKKAQDA